jgi:hypothetical protein
MPVTGNQIRQAVVGRPRAWERTATGDLERVHRFCPSPTADQEIRYYRPDMAPNYPPHREEQWAQTEFYEYHWTT